jgi:hypothetical protein
MINIDITPLLQRLDRIIELLEGKPKQEEKPEEKDEIEPIVFEEIPEEQPKEQSKQANESEYQYDPGWVNCVFNPEFEIQTEMPFIIRHKNTKQECVLRFDKMLYPYPHFDNLKFHNDIHINRYHRIIALNFVPNPENLPYVQVKNGNKCYYDPSNIEWTTQKITSEKITLMQDIIKDPSFMGPIIDVGEDLFNVRSIITYKDDVYQRGTKDAVYWKCYKKDKEFLVISDDNKPIWISKEQFE